MPTGDSSRIADAVGIHERGVIAGRTQAYQLFTELLRTHQCNDQCASKIYTELSDIVRKKGWLRDAKDA